MKVSYREMIIWLQGKWRVWEHGPLPTDLRMSEVMDALASFIEQHRWRKLSEEKPHLNSRCELWDKGMLPGHEIRVATWTNRRGYGPGFGKAKEIEEHDVWWRPIVGPEEL